MADCRFVVVINGVNVPFTQKDFMAYLAKGGANAFSKKYPQLISDKNRDRMDAAIDSIVNRELTEKQAIEIINQQKLSEKTKERLTEYLRQGIRAKKNAGTFKGLTDAQQEVYAAVNNRFLNGEISYEQAMDEFNFFIDRQDDDVAKGIIEEVKNVFFKNNKRQQQKDIEQQQKGSDLDFGKEIGSINFGINENVLTTLASDERLLRGGAEFLNENSFIRDNDQIVAAFLFDQYANDLNGLINAFQRQYGGKYLDKMFEYVQPWGNKKVAGDENAPMSVISTSIALHNHLTELLDTENFKYKSRDAILAMQSENARISQNLGRMASLALNAFRAWRKDLISDLAYVGIITPQIKEEADKIKAAMFYDISDEDLVAFANGDYELFDDEFVEPDKKATEKKKANAVKRFRARKKAAKMNVKSKKDLQNAIKDQIKKCK